MTTPVRPPPPKPAPKPGQVKVVRASYKYDAKYNDELSFDEGDLLYIIDQSDASWWKARCDGREGLIPSNYVEENTESVDNPMHEAAKRGNINFMNECIRNKVSVNGLDKAGSTPLHWATHGGHIECVKMLLAQPRCEINVQNKLGDTPLHHASWKGHSAVVEMLLDQGALTDLKNNEGKTPSAMAKDAKSAALLRQPSVSSAQYATEYGDDEDSD
ncbi:hypothetical protein CAPTEDRAFT_21658 [Capitella teleta]|uniref:Osteoclast-stimulating factor 1 n=1 Tax=Capitella teleta TaxID=283909 RepID=R7UKI0_CAPTE|nr:hypothetical protein CAPTEDRAFT_21658 [Capitella teleta]|eukprot:ELU06725.1 hypothetical protein CAPTEDRAFT_21658 [Capitella teleta]